MIIVIATHFLDEKGASLFPEWVKNMKTILQNWEGFIALNQLKKKSDADSCQLMLQFENMELLKTWAQSEAHTAAMNKLAAHRTQKQQSQIFEVME